MKKVIFTLIINFVCLHFSFGQNYNDVQMYDIYTPMGSLVNTWINEEASISDRITWEDDQKAEFPYAEVIIVYDSLSATRKFNCHGYAWIRVEQGIDRWLGDNKYGGDTHIYMTDSSYIEVPVETFPGKVFWPILSNHSAITTEQPGWFISKWGSGILCRHRWNESPYYPYVGNPNLPGVTTLKYYVKNCAVFGNETVDFVNQTVTLDTNVKSCGDIYVEDVTVTDNAKLTLDAAGSTIIQSDFKVELGSSLEIK